MLTLYGRRDSSNSAKVFWLLDELGLECPLVLTGGKFGGTDAPDYRAIHPFGKVPALRIGPDGLFESQAILRYLATAHPGPLWPENALHRGRIDGWMDWVATALVPPLGRYRKAKGDRTAQLEAATAAFAALDAELRGRDYIAADHLTLADICAGGAVHRWFLITDPRPDLPALAAYRDRLRARPFYRKHVEEALS